ncbi:hypothetical protein LIER_05221 [Lithospermum erythrorhizon]|uniref:Uncharacterized protein n=1 Tax=Lithospermum erythrorhizon TaxID=34254 RepID=A0AAV3P029_LITER
MSQNHSKRKTNPDQSSKRKGLASSSESLPQPTHNNKLVSRGGGFSAYADEKWSDEFPPFLDVSLDLNNYREFLPNENKDHTIPQFQLFDGEDKFSTNCIRKAIIPTASSLGNVNENSEDEGEGDEIR